MPLTPAGSHHVTVVVTDVSSGKRMDRAVVRVRHIPPDAQPSEKTLEPMQAGGVTSLGANFVVSENRGHRFVVEIELDSRTDRIEFRFDNLHGETP